MIPKSSNLLVHIRYDSKRFKFTFTNTLNYFLLPDAKTNRKNKKIKYLQIMQKNLRLERKNSEKQECFFWWLKIIFRRYWKSWFVEIFFADIKQWMQKAKQTCQFFPTSKSQSHANHSFSFFVLFPHVWEILTSLKITFSKTIKVDQKVSGWSLCWNYLFFTDGIQNPKACRVPRKCKVIRKLTECG